MRIRDLVGFIDKSNIIHGNKYDYSKSIYIHSKEKVIIICNIHGEFSQAPSYHMRGSGCPECGELKRKATQSNTFHSRRVNGHIFNANGNCKILLTQDKFSIIDPSDFEDVSKYNWVFTKKGYAEGYINQKKCSLHRYIMRKEEGIDILYVDHIDGDKLNNTRSNLRLCTPQQNNHNRKPLKGSSKYKGVSFDKSLNKWRSVIMKDYKSIYLGAYDSEILAARVYDKKAIELHGEFAKTNF